MPLSDSYAKAILNVMFKGGSLSGSSEVYLGLSTNDPEAGDFYEMSGDTYARVLIAKNGATYPDYMGDVDGRAITNAKQINFNRSTTDWPTIFGFGLFAGKTGGSPYYYARVDNPEGVSVPSNAVALFDPETLKVSIATADV